MAEFPLTNTASDIDTAIQKVVGITTTPTAGNINTVTSGGVHAALQSLNHTNMDAGFLVTEAETIASNDTDTQIPTCAAVNAAVGGTTIKYAFYEKTSGNANSSGTIDVTETLDPDNIGSVSGGVVTLNAGTYLVTWSGSFAEDDNDGSDYATVNFKHDGNVVGNPAFNETGSTARNATGSTTRIITSASPQTVQIDHSNVGATLYYDHVSISILKFA